MIKLKKVCVHNLKGVDLELQPGELIVFTGVSGSGKSSLAFDTIYVEGQRRYIESLSTHARRYMGHLKKPDAELITGISPTIAIEQKTSHKSPRSTVGTLTGIYDFLRVLYARIGIAHCPVSGEPVTPQSTTQIFEAISSRKGKIILLAPYARAKKGEFKEDFLELVRKGFLRARIDGEMVSLTDPPLLDKSKAHDIDLVIDRLKLSKENEGRLKEAISSALELGKGVMSVLFDEDEALFSTHAYSPASGLSYPPLKPHDFSFNHPSGMCDACEGLGTGLEFDIDKIVDADKSINEDCFPLAGHYKTVQWGNIYRNLARLYNFSVRTPWKKLPDSAKEVFLRGTEKKWTRMKFTHPETKKSWSEYVQWRGVLFEAKKRYNEAKSEKYKERMRKLMDVEVCSSCRGSRLKAYPSAAKLGKKSISEITSMTVKETLSFFESLKLTKDEEKIGGELVKEIIRRLHFLLNVGLHYLTIERTSATLSGGESQRVRLASQIGAGLVGTTYILDEPSIGLHPIDNHKLIGTLKALRDSGNTVIVVEHDEETVLSADTVVDVGPGAGSVGGEIVYSGDVQGLLKSRKSLTGDYLSGRKKIPVPTKRRQSKNYLKVTGASEHNLKNLSVKLPLGVFTAITGVSGSGKSTLILDVLYPALSNKIQRSQLKVGKHKTLTGTEEINKVIAIDQSPIGRTPRSNPATYIKLLDDIRDLFTKVPEARAAGFTKGRFSFNVREGSCPKCRGMGFVKVDMDFLDDAEVLCSLCEGKRFDPKTLAIYYRGKNITDVLDLTIDDALLFFENIPHIHHKLKLLSSVGLGYMTIGQSSTTLSGGEAQRIKLAKELIRPATGKTLYILDEPTTGLHFEDAKKLLAILQTLVDAGNTVIVIEHNMDFVRCSDWIIELGPEGGAGGGKIISEGTPETLMKEKSPTGDALSATFKPPARKKRRSAPVKNITLSHAEQNNLKAVSASIPRDKITVCTGPSGSGKSSFAFETIYAEGQRRYIESLSSYTRQFVKMMPKPKLESIEGLSPAISVEQKKHAGNPRSTIGTITEIYDYLRLIYAHMGSAFCPETGEEIRTIHPQDVVKTLMALPEKSRLQILAPLKLRPGEEVKTLIERVRAEGYTRLRIDKEIYKLDEKLPTIEGRKTSMELIIDRIAIKPGVEKRLLEAIEKCGKKLYVLKDDEEIFFNLDFAVPSSGKSYPSLTPHTFSFNSEDGMCPDCQGLGIIYGADLTRYPHILSLTPTELMADLWKDLFSKEAQKLFIDVLKQEKIDPFTPLDEQECVALLKGSKTFIEKNGLKYRFRGLNTLFPLLSKNYRDVLLPHLDSVLCPACHGTRLNPLASKVTVNDLTLGELTSLSLIDAKEHIDKLDGKENAFLNECLEQIGNRLDFLLEIGLDYLSLNRSAPTLSGGEMQRIHLARQLGSGLTGCLYVLDEPTIGLHPENNARLNSALKKLCTSGNTLLLVEHDPLTIESADYLLDFGPKAGNEGGTIIARGTIDKIKENPKSLTGAYLSGRKKIALPKKRRTPKGSIRIENATLNNLKNLTFSIPTNLFCCITGVSGSGKSTLMHDLIRPAAERSVALREPPKELTHKGATLTGLDGFKKCISLDQSPIGTTKRADVTTYSDLLTPLRRFFAELPEAKIRGLLPYNFSYNHLKGMCRRCWGLGHRSIQLQLMPAVKIECDSCHGNRLNPLSLEVTYKGKNLGQILNLTVNEAKGFLPQIPKVQKILDILISVGLGYLKLGQTVATLSGGEAQRLRLSRELLKRSHKKTLYLFDEPTVGLHSEDILQLLPIFHSLVEKGGTLLMIEHNLDLIASADYLIDLGPGAGIHGGAIVAAGTPEKLAKHSTSLTGKYLKTYLL